MQYLQPGVGQPEFALAVARERHRQLLQVAQRPRRPHRSNTDTVRWLDAFLARIGSVLIAIGRRLQSPLLRSFARGAYSEPLQPRLVLAETTCTNVVDCATWTER